MQTYKKLKIDTIISFVSKKLFNKGNRKHFFRVPIYRVVYRNTCAWKFEKKSKLRQKHHPGLKI